MTPSGCLRLLGYVRRERKSAARVAAYDAMMLGRREGDAIDL